MSQIASFLVESLQGSYIPVVVRLIRIDEVEDCLIEPLSYTMPFVELEQAQDFIRVNARPAWLVYDNPIKMNAVGIKWLSEVEAVQ